MQQGAIVAAVVSTDPGLTAWATAHRVPCVSSISELPPAVRLEEIDYLFNILSGKILHSDVLRAPRGFCVNFHDGPLPAYAGVNATSWAIFNGETAHGVTWHVMTEEVDAGDVLKQVHFPIGPGETALSLKLKCYEKGLEAFRELAVELIEGRAGLKPQDLRERTYYGLHRKMPGAGIINWNDSAERTDRLWRALLFDYAPNPLGSVKVLIGERLYAVRTLGVVEPGSGEAPGTVVSLSGGRIRVAASEGDVEFTVSGEDVVPGCRLPLLSPEMLAEAEEFASRASRHEAYWLRQLTDIAGCGAPDTPPVAVSATLPANPEEEILKTTALAAWRRVSGQRKAIVHYYDGSEQDALGLCCPFVPTLIENGVWPSFDEAQRHVPLLRDFVSRYPALRASGLPCSFAFAAGEQEVDDCPLLLRHSGSELTVVSSRSDVDPQQILDAWVRAFKAAVEYGPEVEYWKKKLAGAPALLELPADRPRPAVQIGAAGNFEFTVGGSASNEVLLAVFFVLLKRYSGAADLCVGVAGLNPNTVVIRADGSGNPRFRDFLQHVREVSGDAFAHANLPFEALIEELELERSPSYTPLFQTSFTTEPVDRSVARFDLTLALEEGRRVLLNYSRDLFDAERMERMAGHYARLLESALAEPECEVGELKMLTALEERQLLVEWNRTQTLYPHGTFLQLFAEQAPERIAVECEGRTLTYGELSRWSSGVALALRGCGPVVGIVVERSVEMLAGILGIWKAGAAYVPIDPEYPEERQRFMREDSGAEVVLTREWIAGIEPLEEEVKSALTLESLAYVIYTSGSTGKPKGVAIRHGSLMNLLEGMRRPLNVTADDVMLALATAAFDMSIPELYLTLTTGGRVVLATRDDARDGARLARLLRESGATLMQGTPTTWTMVLDAGWEPLAGFRLLVGAEALPKAVAERLAKLGCPVWNMFGPTETTVWSTMACVDEGPVTIGRPMANTRVYVLDENRQPVPVGVPGELYIGGDGVAVGYWRRPELTEEKFVEFADERVYRTGDRVRYLADGRLEFSARLDQQVKLRGFRIELGEIEAALARHPGVRAAAATIREDEPGDKRLVAYLVADGVTEEALRETVSRALPDYMVPSRFVLLDALPLSANGKVDRRALPKPGAGQEVDRELFTAPRTDVEEMLAQIYAELLQLERVSSHDNFFHLGGHSLSATRVVSRIRERLGVELPVRALFEAPSIAALARRVENAKQGASPALRGYERTGAEPLSFAQQRLWFVDRYHESRSPMYNIAEGLRLRGPLDIERLRRCFAEIAARHETLRTAFRLIDGNPVQTILPETAFELPVEDFDESRIAEEADKPFELERGPMWRVRLWRVRADEHVLMLTMHHIISDGWSFGLLYRELRELYADRPLPALPIQYADFAQWQREWLSGERLEREIAYWKQQLAGAPPLLELPMDRPRPAVQTYAAGNYEFALSPELAASAQTFSAREGVTLFMTLLAAFDALLVRYTGTADISIGMPIANRTRAETEGLIGFFTNMLVLRTDAGGEPSFRELLGRVRETCLAAYEHQDLPFEKLVEEIAPERSQSHTPLFQVVFVLQNADAAGLELAGIEAERMPVPLSTARFDLTVAIEERSGRMNVLFNYNRDLFDAARMERMAGHYATLLDAAIRGPAQKIGDLPVLTQSEERQLAQWNGMRADYPDRTLSELFRCDPDRIAVECQGRTLTYAELDSRSNAVAAKLRKIGIGPEMIVGIRMERSVEMLAGLIGIWKAGAAYLPLDPAYPKQRLEFMRDDSGSAMVITEEFFADLEPDGAPINLIALDGTAYVIYTSGATGEPKGVPITHRSLLNFLEAMRVETGISEADVFTAVTTLSFDISAMELFLPLLAGARLVIATACQASDGKELARLTDETGATIFFATPAMWRLLIGAGWRGKPNLKLLCGGEAMTRRLADELLARGAAVWNMFGPTETTICSTIARVEPGDEAIPIGRPIANTQVYAMDESGRPVPVGVPGELWIGGVGVARGYLNRPELTAAKFTPDGRYRTGDRVRFRPDGNLEFLSRLDHQVKIRGFRVEPGEIEAALLRDGQVKEAAVVAEDEKLIAYVISDAPAGQLRDAVCRVLPEHMTPARFVYLDAMPLTANGKIDRRALAKQKPVEPVEDKPFIRPRTLVEKAVANIFEEVLDVERVAADDNFFHLGGHSLLVMQLLSRIWEMWKVELPVRALFEAPTVAALAQRIQDAQAPRTEIRPRASAKPVLSFAQQRVWFLDRFHESERALYNVPAVVRLQGAFDRAAFARALNEVIRRHDSLRTNFVEVDGEVTPVIRPELVIDVPMVSCDDARREILRPFDLASDPLVRACLAELEPEEYELVLVTHHIAADGWSMGVLFREVNALYRGASLGPLPLQYAEYAREQREVLTTEVIERHVSYWRKQLAGLPDALNLPADRPRPAIQTYNAAIVRRGLPRRFADAVKELSRREGATEFIVFLAAFQALLYRYSGDADICVGTPVANRTRMETEGLIGLFANMLPLRTAIAGAITFRELIARTRETAIEAYAHQELPFEKLIEALDPTRSLSHSPLFQVLFTFQNSVREMLDLPGVRAGRPVFELGLVKLDLVMSVEEVGGGLEIVLEYNRDLFDEERMERMAGHYVRLLESALAGPELAIGELPMLTEAEERTLLVEWNHTQAAYPQRTFPELFAEQVQKAGGRVAVECDDRSLTYLELDARSNAVAAELRRLGAGPETLVGILGERSVEMLCGLIGIWKTGAAYVPIDPAHPEERQRFIREDSGVKIVVTREWVAGLGVRERFDGQGAGLENLAYVIYTSGSTGNPKGVAIPHRALANFWFAMQQGIGIAAEDALVAVTTLSFDIAGLELFWPLLNGARVVIAAQETVSDSAKLANLIAKSGATMMQATPATWRLLIEGGWRGKRNLRILCGGEALPQPLAAALRARGSDAWNLFGPTETTIWSTMERLGEGPVTIGRPIANTSVYVLDERQQPVPPGVTGELYIGGDGLARGYWNREDLTRERFAAHARFGRLYRTGDFARWTYSGKLEFLGRLDHQVKLRGFRIELGEVEAALRRVAGVRDAAVTVCEERLIAYLVGEGLAANDLRDAVKRILPDYMVPSQFVIVDALPLTPNGKIDRQALANWNSGLEDVSEYAAPDGPLEDALAHIFVEVLQLERISARANFFEAGGHSLLATQVVSRVRQRLGIEAPVRAVFEAPSVRELARHLAGVRQEEGSAIQPYARTGAEPLSFAQERLWFHDRYYGGRDTIYNLADVFRLTGSLDVERLSSALQSLAVRHETLRTAICDVDGSPVQVIGNAAPVAFEVEDINEEDLRSCVTAEQGKPFALSSGPLWRVRLLRLGLREHVLVFVAHHIVADGWSLGVAYRELQALYAGEPLPALAIQYADFAQWQRDWLAGDRLARELDYWQRQMAGAPSLLELPWDRPRPANQTYRAGSVRFSFDEELAAALVNWTGREGVTLFMTLLAGFHALLARCARTEDIVVGTPIANRTRIETEGLIGFFANTLVMRTRVTGSEPFRDLAASVKETALEAYAHQELPFEKLVEMLQPERSVSFTPLFQVLFLMQNVNREGLALPGLEVRREPVEMLTTPFDLILCIEESDRGLAGILTYNSDLFDAATIERMSQHYGNLLRGAMAGPDCAVGDLPLLSPDEERTLLVERNATQAAYPQRTFPQLFAEQVRLSCDRVAVECEGGALTYRELDTRSNAVAAALKRLGAGPETRVGILGERSLEMLCGLIGVWKAGAAYVPIDPAYPEERKRFMREDSGAEIVITREWVAGLGKLDRFEPPELPLESLAYVIYTSGSTGAPKGVAIPHRALANFWFAMQRGIGIAPEDVLLAVTTLSFDIAGLELFWPLLNGARVVIATQEAAADSRKLADLISHSGATIMQATPATWRLLIEGGWRGKRDLRILCGGEALPETLARELRARGAEVWNLFGPTETTIWSTMARVGDGPVRIGGPIANTMVYVLDPQQQPVPAGVPGELYIGGEGLARGYWNREELRRERFVDHARFGRLYRTGDLVRWTPEGLDFLGRLDHQVKVRGFRVELGEVEAALRAIGGIRDAVVFAENDRLVAWIAGDPLDSRDLRAALAKRLPAYMIPAAFAFCEALPLTANGKIDRRALASASEFEIAPSAERMPPRDALEAKLIEIWESVLEMRGLDRTANFFDLGGHSLQAMRLLKMMEQETRKTVPLHIFFGGPTIELVAAYLRSQQKTAAIRPQGSQRTFFCVEAQGMGGELADEFRREHAFTRLHWPEPEELSTRYSIENIAAHLIGRIREQQPHGPYAISGWRIAGALAFEIAQQLTEQGETVDLLVMFGGTNPAFAPKRSLVRRLRDAFGRIVHRDSALAAWSSYRPRPYSGRVVYFGRVMQESGWDSVVERGLEIYNAGGSDAHDVTRKLSELLDEAAEEPEMEGAAAAGTRGR